jgi:hypothetical protein
VQLEYRNLQAYEKRTLLIINNLFKGNVITLSTLIDVSNSLRFKSANYLIFFITVYQDWSSVCVLSYWVGFWVRSEGYAERNLSSGTGDPKARRDGRDVRRTQSLSEGVLKDTPADIPFRESFREAQSLNSPSTLQEDPFF